MQSGDTALVVLLPDADPIVGQVRSIHDPAAGQGVPAHITIMYPFLPRDQVGPAEHAAIGALANAHRPFTTTLAPPSDIGGLLVLRPQPDAPFFALQDGVRARWPTLVPYRGKYGDRPTPHLTLAYASDRAVSAEPADFADISVALSPHFPLLTHATHVALLERRDDRWRLVDRWALTGAH